MKEVVGCGIDIEELIRFKTKLPDISGSSGFNNMVYTIAEIETNRLIRPELTFPLSFCCKEAIFKAFGVSWTNSDISWKDIELLFSDQNNLEDYSIRLNGFAEELFKNRMCTGIESKIEFTGDYVMFQVVLLSKQT